MKLYKGGYMKGFIKSIIIIGVCCFIVFFINDYTSKDYSMKVFSEELSYNLMYKGIYSARDFTFDVEQNCYIAYKDRIQFVGNAGKSYNVLKDVNMDIYSVEYYKEKLYFSSGNSIYEQDLNTKKTNELIKDLPNFGDCNMTLIKANEGFLYISIGAATNSGVVGADNEWIKDYPSAHDITPYDITLEGLNFGDTKTGAFVEKNSKTVEGQIITGNCPGNASVIIYNLNTRDRTTFAWGLRNINGMDFNSRSQLMASVGGMEDRGLRPIKGDVDYIYEIRSKQWYGWPDYSGGDPVNSPRFRGDNEKAVLPLLENQPNTNPAAPIYQHRSLGTLKSLAIDRCGSIGNIDGIYFYDSEDKAVYSLNSELLLNKIIEIQKNGTIFSLKFYNENLFILDGVNGTLYNVHNESKVNDSTILYKGLFWILISFIFLLMGYFIYTVIKSRNKLD